MSLMRLALFVSAATLLTGSVRTDAQGPLPPPPRSILIDVVGGGGAWWFPQAPPFDPDLYHQGKPLYEFLRSSGFSVTVHGDGPITPELLAPHDIVITLSSGARSPAELNVWLDYVTAGGKLVLLSDLGTSSELPRAFGLEVGDQIVDGPVSGFPAHPITQGVTTVRFFGGRAYTAWPEAATILGFIDDAPVMGVVRVGDGDVFFMGDINAFQILPNVNNWVRPLLDNLLDFLAGQRPPLVVPLSAYVLEANTRNRIPFFSVDLFAQPDVACWEQVYDAREFTFTGPREITELAFRLDGAQGPVSITLSDVEIQLATTTRPPDGLDNLFFCVGTNAESATTVVRQDRLDLSSNGDRTPLGQALPNFPWLNAKAFDVVVPIQPFSYDPADGNLLVRITTVGSVIEDFQGADLRNTFLDAVLAVGDAVSSVWVLSPFVNTSFRESRGLVTQFRFAETQFNRNPVAAAGFDQSGVACTSPAGGLVTLDGSGSTDPDFDVLTYTWTGPFPEGGGRVTGVNPVVTLPLGGPHTVVLTVEDPGGRSDVDGVLITVEDTVPPLLTLMASSIEVGPGAPEGMALDVLAASGATAVDICDPNPSLTHDAPAIFPAGSTTDVTLTATDVSANSTSRVFTVTVLSAAGATGELVSTVLGLGLPQADARALAAPLGAATNVLGDANPRNDAAAVGSLQAFVRSVEARRGRTLTEAQADQLIAAAQAIIGALGG
jgi:hypothetical protein